MGSITNDGQICLNNQFMNKQLKLRVRVVSLLKDSTIYIANVVLAVSSKQNFYLTIKVHQ